MARSSFVGFNHVIGERRVWSGVEGTECGYHLIILTRSLLSFLLVVLLLGRDITWAGEIDLSG